MKIHDQMTNIAVFILLLILLKTHLLSIFKRNLNLNGIMKECQNIIY